MEVNMFHDKMEVKLQAFKKINSSENFAWMVQQNEKR
jgi:hypothetical protein